MYRNFILFSDRCKSYPDRHRFVPIQKGDRFPLVFIYLPYFFKVQYFFEFHKVPGWLAGWLVSSIKIWVILGQWISNYP